jgi:hypothetical protein
VRVGEVPTPLAAALKVLFSIKPSQERLGPDFTIFDRQTRSAHKRTWRLSQEDGVRVFIGGAMILTAITNIR